MKRFVLLMSCLMIVGLPVAAVEAAPTSADQVDDINYSYGYQLGRELLTSGVELRLDALSHALYAVQDGTAPVLSREEMSGFLERLQAGSSIAVAAPTAIIADEVDAANYSFGFTLSERMLQRQVVLQDEPFSNGLNDAFGQKSPRLSKEVMAQLLDPEQIAGSAVDEAPKTFRLPGQKFISENSSKEGVVTLDSGLQYKVLKVGTGQKKPQLTDSVLVNYTAKSIDGKEFYSTFPLGIPTPEEVPVNKGIAGWKEALLLMHAGDRWELTIPTRLGYRDTGPLGGQTVIIDLELLEILSER